MIKVFSFRNNLFILNEMDQEFFYRLEKFENRVEVEDKFKKT